MKYCAYTFILFFALLGHLQVFASPPFDSCEADFQKIEEASRKIIASNSFNVRRDLHSYEKTFGESFRDILRHLGPSDRWLDSGAGYALAQGDFLKKSTEGQLVALALKKPENYKISGPADSERFKYIGGRLLEEIPNSELGKFKIITDFYGPGSYSPDFSQVLQKYIDLLADDGSLYLAFDKQSQKVKINGNEIGIAEWIESIPGLNARKTKGNRDAIALLISKKAPGSINIPKLEIETFNPGAPPQRIYRATSAAPVKEIEPKLIPIDEVGELKEIPSEELKHLVESPSNGKGYNHFMLYEGTLNNKDVFVKVSIVQKDRRLNDSVFEAEAQWTKYLSDAGVGPKYHGITVVKNNYAIVVDTIPGVHVGSVDDLRKVKSRINKNTLDDLKKIKEVFKKNQIIPMDFQFRIDTKGHAWVIDPAQYQQTSETSFPALQFPPWDLVNKYIKFAEETLSSAQ